MCFKNRFLHVSYCTGGDSLCVNMNFYKQNKSKKRQTNQQLPLQNELDLLFDYYLLYFQRKLIKVNDMLLFSYLICIVFLSVQCANVVHCIHCIDRQSCLKVENSVCHLAGEVK